MSNGRRTIHRIAARSACGQGGWERLIKFRARELPLLRCQGRCGGRRSLVAALLLSQPRANLEQRLKDSKSNPILVLAHLLSDGIRPSSVTVPSVPFLPSPPPPPTPLGRARRLPARPSATPALPMPPAQPLPMLPPVPVESTRFSLLEIDDPSDD